jgi:hypothetical protein
MRATEGAAMSAATNRNADDISEGDPERYLDRLRSSRWSSVLKKCKKNS